MTDKNKFHYSINVNQSDEGVLTFNCRVEVEMDTNNSFPVYQQVKDLTKLLNSQFDVKHQKYMLGIKENHK